jgi:hypothetical protein
MSSVRAILTTQPDREARAILYKDTSTNILWSECRLIWDSASLISTEAGGSEVTLPVVAHAARLTQTSYRSASTVPKANIQHMPEIYTDSGCSTATQLNQIEDTWFKSVEVRPAVRIGRWTWYMRRDRKMAEKVPFGRRFER